MDLNKLPEELIEKILIFLSGFDILSLSECNKQFYHLCSSNRIWKLRAEKDFKIELNIENLQSTQCRTLYPLKQFYLKILQPLGPFLLKSWLLCDNQPYGGLVKIQYHDLNLCVVLFHPPPYPNTHYPLQPEIIFSIGINDGIHDMRWKFNLGWFSLEHASASDKGPTVKLRIRKQKYGEVLKAGTVWTGHRKTSQRRLNDIHGGNLIEINSEVATKKVLKKESLVEFQQRIGLPIGSRCTSDRLEAYRRLATNPIKQMISIDTDCYNSTFCPIKPGLYNGTYSDQGIQIVNVLYEEGGKRLTGRKITGDENVHSSATTFKAFVNKQIFVSNEMEHHSISSTAYHKCFIEHKVNFVLPMGYNADVELNRDIFRYEIGRYPAQAQVHMDPSFIEARLVVFAENIFGVIWFGLKSMSIFEKHIEEDVVIPNTMTKSENKL